MWVQFICDGSVSPTLDGWNTADKSPWIIHSLRAGWLNGIRGSPGPGWRCCATGGYKGCAEIISMSQFLSRTVCSQIMTCTKIHLYRPQTKLREGNVFTHVCDSVYSEVESVSRRVSVWGGLCPGGLYRGGSLSRKTTQQRPSYGKERVVCILLECILVTFKNSYFTHLTYIWAPCLVLFKNIFNMHYY